MDLKTRMDILLEYYNHLGRMKTAFKELPTPYVSNSDLSTFGVQLSEMSLRPEDTTESGPRYCRLFPAHEFDDMFEKAGKPEWRKPAPEFNGNFYEGYGLERWFSDCLGCSRYEWHLLASGKWLKQV